MLGKLIKHEIKNSARYVMAIYFAAAAVCAFMLLGMLAKVMWVTVVGSMLLYTVGIAAVIMTLVSVIKNFYDSLYGRQGYLTFTLPVKCSSILISKVLVSFFWIILSFLLLVLIFVLIFENAKAQTGESLGGVVEALEVSGILEMLPSLNMIIRFASVLGSVALMYILTFVGFVYFSVTLANTRSLQKHPKLFGFMIFFGIYSVANSLGAVITSKFPLSFNITNQKCFLAFTAMSREEGVIASFGLGGAIFMALMAVGLLFATGWFMEHKVNVK